MSDENPPMNELTLRHRIIIIIITRNMTTSNKHTFTGTHKMYGMSVPIESDNDNNSDTTSVSLRLKVLLLTNQSNPLDITLLLR